MDTRMLGYERAVTVAEIASWANELPGKEMPGEPGYQIVGVVQFQFVEHNGNYAALLLVEVTTLPSEGQLAFKEEDIVAIEQLTSSIESAPANEIPLPEE